jgi:ferredoxin
VIQTIAMRVYEIKLQTPNGDQRISCEGDEYILDRAGDFNIDLPYSCRAGACSTCVGKLISGMVDQSRQSFLDDDQLEAGYVLLCCAKPMDDCTIETHVELRAPRKIPTPIALVRI